MIIMGAKGDSCGVRISGFSMMSEHQHKSATFKHPVMSGREVREALENPGEVRRSKRDACVYLFCRTERPKRWLCPMVRPNEEAFARAYTNAIKIGEERMEKLRINSEIH
jgi:hypothetical protein